MNIPRPPTYKELANVLKKFYWEPDAIYENDFVFTGINITYRKEEGIFPRGEYISPDEIEKYWNRRLLISIYQNGYITLRRGTMKPIREVDILAKYNIKDYECLDYLVQDLVDYSKRLFNIVAEF